VKKRWWRILVPSLVAVSVVGVAVPWAMAGELDNDTVNNRLQVRTTLSCERNTAVLNWTSIVPAATVSMTAKWYDITADPNFNSPKPISRIAQLAAVHVDTEVGDRANGSFKLTGVQSGHRVAIFVDAWSEAGGSGQQIGGLGRNIDTVIRCVNGRPVG
jgi:hypothetical protein